MPITGEGRALPQPALEGSSPGTAPAEAASSSQSLADGEQVGSWQRLLEEMLPHPVKLRVELVGEFREPQAWGH